MKLLKTTRSLSISLIILFCVSCLTAPEGSRIDEPFLNGSIGGNTPANPTDPTPTISAVTPKYARQADTITVTGTHFALGMTIDLDATPCGTLSVVNATTATCVVPNRAKPLLMNVTVTTSHGTVTSNHGFTHIGNPKFWIKADTMLGTYANGDGMNGGWFDSSASNYSLGTTSSTFAPTFQTGVVNGLPAALFDGSDDFMNIHSDYIYSTTGGLTSFFVANSLSDRSVPFLADFGAYAGTSYGFQYDLDTLGITTPSLSGGTLTTGSHSTGAGVFMIYTGEIIFGVEQRARINGGAAISAPITLTQLTANEINEDTVRSTTSGPFTLAKQSKSSSDAGRNLHGHIAEVMVYTEATLTTTERETVECYLSHKYNLPVAQTCP